MDRDHLEYNLKEISKHKNMPFDLANEKLAELFYENSVFKQI